MIKSGMGQYSQCLAWSFFRAGWTVLYYKELIRLSSGFLLRARGILSWHLTPVLRRTRTKTETTKGPKWLVFIILAISTEFHELFNQIFFNGHLDDILPLQCI